MVKEEQNSQARCSSFSCIEETIPSCDGVSNLRLKIWNPVSAVPWGIVQLVHGMAEHIDRYNDFAQFLAARGLVVVGHDHIGHGKSAESLDALGVMPLKGGAEVLVSDAHNVRRVVQPCYEALYGAIPYVMFGHSMGSFVVRCYLARYNALGNSTEFDNAQLANAELDKAQLAGAVICGTGNQPLALSYLGRSVARILGAIEGAECKSALLEDLIIGSFALPFAEEPSRNAWISSDPAVVAAYDADPLSGAMFSAGGFATLTDLSAQAALPQTYDISPELPLLFIAGEKDSVGGFGKGVIQVADAYRKAGSHEVEVRIYPGMRHEVLNEPGNYRVYNDVLDWLKRVL